MLHKVPVCNCRPACLELSPVEQPLRLQPASCLSEPLPACFLLPLPLPATQDHGPAGAQAAAHRAGRLPAAQRGPLAGGQAAGQQRAERGAAGGAAAAAAGRRKGAGGLGCGVRASPTAAPPACCLHPPFIVHCQL